MVLYLFKIFYIYILYLYTIHYPCFFYKSAGYALIQLPEFLLAMYAYARKLIRDEVENEDRLTYNNAIPTSVSGEEQQRCTVNTINTLIKRNDEFDLKFQELTRKVDIISIQISKIVRK